MKSSICSPRRRARRGHIRSDRFVISFAIQAMKAAGYTVLLVWSRDDKAFIARAFELPGCVAHGETREEAVEPIQMAIKNWVDTAKSMGLKYRNQ